MPGSIIDSVKVGDVGVIFADVDGLCGGAAAGAAITSAGGEAEKGPALLVKRKGLQVHDANVDDLLGPSYDVALPRPLRTWTDAPVGVMPEPLHAFTGGGHPDMAPS